MGREGGREGASLYHVIRQQHIALPLDLVQFFFSLHLHGKNKTL